MLINVDRIDIPRSTLNQLEVVKKKKKEETKTSGETIGMMGQSISLQKKKSR